MLHCIILSILDSQDSQESQDSQASQVLEKDSSLCLLLSSSISLLSFFHSHTEGKTHSMSLSQSLCVPTYVRMLQVFSLFFCENDSVCLSTLCATLLFFNEGTFEGVKLFIFSMMGWTMEAPLTIHFLNEGVNERGSCSSLSR